MIDDAGDSVALGLSSKCHEWKLELHQQYEAKLRCFSRLSGIARLSDTHAHEAAVNDELSSKSARLWGLKTLPTSQDVSMPMLPRAFLTSSPYLHLLTYTFCYLLGYLH